MPALSAGPSWSTADTSAPRGRSRPKDSASCAFTSWMVTPMRPRTTRPVLMSCSSTLRATSIGIAKDTPMKPPVRLKICELMPTTSPSMLNSGPPELPGFTATSVWMKGT